MAVDTAVVAVAVAAAILFLGYRRNRSSTLLPSKNGKSVTHKKPEHRRMQRKLGSPRHIALWKPYLTLSSFVDDEHGARGRATLAGLNLPDGVMNVGRLDRDSEGLLLLTDDGALCDRVLQGGVQKRYLALVRGQPSDVAIATMAAGGLAIRGRVTRPCAVRRLDWCETNAALPPSAAVPAGAECAVASTWIEVRIDEGMNRQIRRMTAHAGHKTLRLVRMGVGLLHAEQLALRPGEWTYVERADILED